MLAAFAAAWLAAPLVLLEPNRVPFTPSQAPAWRFWGWYGLLAMLFLAELPFAHAPAFVMAVYITIITVGRFGPRSAPAVLALALASLLVPVAIPSWHDSIGAAVRHRHPGRDPDQPRS